MAIANRRAPVLVGLNVLFEPALNGVSFPPIGATREPLGIVLGMYQPKWAAPSGVEIWLCPQGVIVIVPSAVIVTLSPRSTLSDESLKLRCTRFVLSMVIVLRMSGFLV